MIANVNEQPTVVVGAGQMGSGIAQVTAQIGHRVFLVDSAPGAKDRGLAGIRKSLEKLAEKQAITEKPEAVLSRIGFVEKVADLKDLQPSLVIEAITENFETKAKLFRDLDEVMPKSTILASNTSSISITRLGACTKRPEKVVGMHFMNPVPLMKLVELIRGLVTDEETYQFVRRRSELMGKTVTVSKDMPGFIANRILMPMINEAVFTLGEGIATVEDIDTTMKLGMNHPMGPLTLADFIGLDTCLAIMEVLHEGLGDDKYRPAPLLRQYVQAGWLGKKTKRGFYKYE